MYKYAFNTLVLATLMTFSITSTHAAQALGYQSIDKTAAIVEDSVILSSEIKQRIYHLRAKKPGMEITQQVRRGILNQLILERLQLRLAKRLKLSVSDAEVESTLSQLQRGLVQQGEDFASYLNQQQYSEAELRQAIRKDITLRKLQEGTINRRLQITEREIDEFLQSKAGQDWLTTRFRINHILLPINDGNEEQQVQLANTILQQVQSGASPFADLAREYSKGPNASKGGDLGWRTKDQIPQLFYDAIAALDAGELSQVLRSSAGIHVLEVVQRSGAKPVMITRYRPRHILIKPNELFTDAEAKIKIDKIYQLLQDGQDFIELAKKFTEDTGSKSSGGDLGWSTPGQFVPAFERSMTATPKGMVSEPFRSQFGWHILRVDDSKVEDMFDTVKRNQAANILRQRRFEDELQLWYEELRENAYVEIL